MHIPTGVRSAYHLQFSSVRCDHLTKMETAQKSRRCLFAFERLGHRHLFGLAQHTALCVQTSWQEKQKSLNLAG